MAAKYCLDSGRIDFFLHQFGLARQAMLIRLPFGITTSVIIDGQAVYISLLDEMYKWDTIGPALKPLLLRANKNPQRLVAWWMYQGSGSSGGFVSLVNPGTRSDEKLA